MNRLRYTNAETDDKTKDHQQHTGLDEVAVLPRHASPAAAESFLLLLGLDHLFLLVPVGPHVRGAALCLHGHES